MKRTMVVVAAIMLVISGAGAQPTPPAARKAQDDWVACRTAKAVELDDGISDARTIATAVTAACRIYREQMHDALGFLSASGRDRSLRMMLADDVDRCTLVVIEARKARRAPAAPASSPKAKPDAGRI